MANACVDDFANSRINQPFSWLVSNIIEGPLLRAFHLAILKFETAGQAAGQANDMKLVGIIGAMEFRNRILEARDRLKAKDRAGSKATEAEILTAIHRDIQEMLELMRQRQAQS